MGTSSQRVTLIGAGLNGPLLAIALARRGYGVEIYERRPDLREADISAGRSINLAVSARGIHALQQIGLWDSMRAIVTPMKGRMMHAVNGDLTFQPYGKNDNEVIYSIARKELNIALLTVAEVAGVSIHFNERCTGFDRESGTLQLKNEVTGEENRLKAEVTIGCDGSASAIRGGIGKLASFQSSQERLDYGYKELTIPAGATGKHAIETHALHIWPRGSFMLIALPNLDGTFACILFLPFEGGVSFESLKTGGEAAAFFEQQFPDALELMPGLAENFDANPVGAMVTVKCSPWHIDDKVLLLGDAAHAVVPFLGQGINCGFEDCMVLIALIEKHGGDWGSVFDDFEKMRKPNTDALADMAVENFVEMRDRVADPAFLLKKKVELALEARFPKIFVPRYAMVTFHRVPYAVAQERGVLQDEVLSQLCSHITSVEQLDWMKAEALVGKLTPLEQAL